jgi:hypothetical protein
MLSSILGLMLSSIVRAAMLYPPPRNKGRKRPAKGLSCHICGLPTRADFFQINLDVSSYLPPAQSSGLFLFLTLHCIYV